MIFYPSALLQLVLLLSYRFSLGSNTHALFSTSFRLARNQNFCNLKFMLFALLSDVFPTRRGVCVRRVYFELACHTNAQNKTRI